MSNRQKIDELRRQLAQETAPIEKRYNEQIRALYHQFTVEEIEALGWSYYEFYGPGQEHVYKKGNARIRVGPLAHEEKPNEYGYRDFKRDNNGNTYLEKDIYLFTYNGLTRTIVDVDDLNEYEKTGI